MRWPVFLLPIVIGALATGIVYRFLSVDYGAEAAAATDDSIPDDAEASAGRADIAAPLGAQSRGFAPALVAFATSVGVCVVVGGFIATAIGSGDAGHFNSSVLIEGLLGGGLVGLGIGVVLGAFVAGAVWFGGRGQG